MDSGIHRLKDQTGRRGEDFARFRDTLPKDILGQEAVTDRPVIALCPDGHFLHEGVPLIAMVPTIRTL